MANMTELEMNTHFREREQDREVEENCCMEAVVWGG